MRVKDHAYSYRLLVRNNWEGNPACPLPLSYSSQNSLVPFVSFCLFYQNRHCPAVWRCSVWCLSPHLARGLGEKGAYFLLCRANLWPVGVRRVRLQGDLQLTQHGQAAVQGRSGLSPWKPESTVMSRKWPRRKSESTAEESACCVRPLYTLTI